MPRKRKPPTRPLSTPEKVDYNSGVLIETFRYQKEHRIGIWELVRLAYFDKGFTNKEGQKSLENIGTWLMGEEKLDQSVAINLLAEIIRVGVVEMRRNKP